jgi:NADH pyrophosphatase NudC (nudix superfamily)
MSQRPRIQHCPACGSPVVYRVPPDDNRERATCTACQTIHYENPLNVVGTVPVWGDQVLLCRRNIEPRFGLWTLPAGFMELGETTAEGAARETDEEAGARIETARRCSRC